MNSSRVNMEIEILSSKLESTKRVIDRQDTFNTTNGGSRLLEKPSVILY